MKFCQCVMQVFQQVSCCKNHSSHSQQPSFGTIDLSGEDQEFSNSSSINKPSESFKLQLSSTENKPTLETFDSQRLSQVLLTDDCIQSIDKDFNQIWDAVDNNDMPAVNDFLGSNDGNLEDYDGFSLLHRSVIAGHREMTEKLVTKFSISQKDRTGRTPLHYACIKSNPEIIELLLRNSANPLDQDLFGKYPADYCSNSLDIKRLFYFVRSDCNTSLSLDRRPGKTQKKLRKYKSQNIGKPSPNAGSSLQVGNLKVRRLTGPIDKGSNLAFLQDFEVVKILGVSIIGIVYLVKNEKTGAEYALKVIEKIKLRNQQEKQMVYTEKKLLVLFNHPFITPLVYSFQTKHKLVLATPFCSGGSLYDQLLQKGKMEIDEIRLYASEIIDALEYIHDSGFVFRALVLRNILVSADGHVMLSNFQLAKEDIPGGLGPDSLFDQNHETAFEQHGKKLDFYMFGLALFELATGASYKKDLIEIKNLVFKELLTGLLEPVGPLNLGFEKIADLKNHDFFLGINWFQVKFSRQKMPDVADLDVLPQFTELELSVNQEFTSEKPYPNWSFTY